MTVVVRGQKVTFTFNCSGVAVDGLVLNRIEVIDYGYKSKIVCTSRAFGGRQALSKTYNLAGYENHPAPPEYLQAVIKQARLTMGENPPQEAR